MERLGVSLVPSRINIGCIRSSSYRPRKPDYYTVLGVSRGASADEIKDAFVQKCRELHPDGKDSIKLRGSKPLAEPFMELKAAYDVLRKPSRRADYDREYQIRSSQFTYQKVSGPVADIFRRFGGTSFKEYSSLFSSGHSQPHFRDYSAEYNRARLEGKGLVIFIFMTIVFILGDILYLKYSSLHRDTSKNSSNLKSS